MGDIFDDVAGNSGQTAVAGGWDVFDEVTSSPAPRPQSGGAEGNPYGEYPDPISYYNANGSIHQTSLPFGINEHTYRFDPVTKTEEEVPASEFDKQGEMYKKWLAWREAQRQASIPKAKAPGERGAAGGIGAGFVRGAGTALQAIGNYAEYVNASKGGTPADPGDPNALVSAGQQVAAQAPASESLTQPGQEFQPTNWRWYSEHGAEMVPTLLAQVGTLAASKGQSAPMQFMAFAGPAAVEVAGATYDTTLKRTGDANLATGEATANGIVSLAMQKLNLAPLLTNSATKKYFQQQVLNRITQIGVKSFQEAASNAVVSVAQTAAEDTIKYAAENDPEAYKDWQSRYAGAALQGGVAGAAIGGLHAAGEGGAKAGEKPAKEGGLTPAPTEQISPPDPAAVQKSIEETETGDITAQMTALRKEKWDSLTPAQRTALLNQPARPKANLAPDAVREAALARINAHLDAMGPAKPLPNDAYDTKVPTVPPEQMKPSEFGGYVEEHPPIQPATEAPKVIEDTPAVRDWAKAEAEKHGAKFDGIQEGVEDTDPKTVQITIPDAGRINKKTGKPQGTTINVPAGEDIGARIAAKRAEFAAAEANAKKTGPNPFEAGMKKGATDASKVTGAVEVGGQRGGIEGPGRGGPEGVVEGERGAEAPRPGAVEGEKPTAGEPANTSEVVKPQEPAKLDEGITHTAQSLRGMKHAEVKAIAKGLGIDATGTKEVITKRIISKQGEASIADFKAKLPGMKWHEVEAVIKKMIASGRDTYAGSEMYQAAKEALTEKLQAQRDRADEIGIGDVIGKEDKSPPDTRKPAFRTAADKKAVSEGADPKEVARLSARRAATEPDAVYMIQSGGATKKAAGDILKFRDFVRAEPEFHADPTFTVGPDGAKGFMLHWKDGGSYKFVPEAIGISSEGLTEGMKLRVNPEEIMRAKKGDSLRAATSADGFNPTPQGNEKGAGTALRLHREMSPAPDLHAFGGPVGEQIWGDKSILKKDIIPKAAEAASAIGEAASDIRKVFAPQTKNEAAGKMGGMVRESAATLAQRTDRAEAALNVGRKFLDSLPKDQQLEFNDAIETGAKQPDPKLQAIADSLRNLLDQRRAEVQALGTGKLTHFIKDYLPHIWKDPEAAGSWLGQVIGKRPLEGSKSFLKKRSIPTIKEGIAAGLEPVSTNAVDLTLLKVREMDKYILGQRLLAEAKATGLAKFVKATEQAPDGYSKINDKIAQKYAPPTIPITEHVGRDQYNALMQVADSLGLKTKRVSSAVSEAKKQGFKVDRGTLGYAEHVSKANVARYATGLTVLAHEIGHHIDRKYDLSTNVINKNPAQMAKITQDIKVGGMKEVLRLSEKKWDYYFSRSEQAAQIVEAFIHAPDKFKALAPDIYNAFSDLVDKHPELAPLKTQSSLTLEAITTDVPHGGLLKMGEYYALDGAADVLNNYLSPGLRGKSGIFRGVLGAGNFLNQAQLGLSAFHLGFTSLDAATSKFALGLQHLTDGKIGEFAKSMALTPLAPIENMVRGNKILREWMKPGSQGAEIAAIVDSMKAAGGRAGMDRFYQTTIGQNMVRAFREGNYLGAAVRGPFAAMEAAATPIMKWIVPRQKMGIFADMAKRELGKLGPDADRDQVRAVMGKAWDSVDNRMGQMVYDNLFWNKTAKDLGMASIRSLGWNLGTLRELGGGVLDSIMAGKKLLSGKRPEVTYRMAYVASLPIVTGMLGAMMQYLWTGKGPQSLHDYYYPKTGEKDDEGKDKRVALPSYMKDVYAYMHSPGQTLLHKLHPDIGLMADMLQNKDFYGTEIRHPDDPAMKQILDVASYVGKQFIPFGVRNAIDSGNKAGKILPFIGVTPAPKSITNTPAEELAGELVKNELPVGSRTQEQADKAAKVRGLRKELAAGVDNRDKALEAGQLTPQDAQKLGKSQGQNYLVRAVKGLDSSDAVKVYQAANEREREQIYAMVDVKIGRAKSLTQEQKEKLWAIIRKDKPAEPWAVPPDLDN